MTTSTLNARIPEHAPYLGSADSDWDRIPLGVGADGEVAWNPSNAPHLLITGPVGSGKSVVQRNILLHLLQHKDKWGFIGIDPKGVELTSYAEYEVVRDIATTPTDAVSLLRNVELELHNRYALMENEGVQRFTDLSNPPEALLVMIDLLPNLLSPHPENRSAMVLKATAERILVYLAKWGRTAGIHLVCGAQRADTSTFRRKLKCNFTARIACGQMSETASQLALDSDAAMHLPADVRGRAIIQVHGQDEEFQMYYAPPTWADENLSYLSET